MMVMTMMMMRGGGDGPSFPRLVMNDVNYCESSGVGIGIVNLYHDVIKSKITIANMVMRHRIWRI